MTETPEWRDVPETNGRYQVSDQGRLRRLGAPIWTDPETGLTHRKAPPKPVKAMRSLSGYLMAELWVDGKRTRRNLADVVGEAFHGSIDPKTHQYLLVSTETETDDYRSDPLAYRVANIEPRKRVAREPTVAARKAAEKFGITL